MHHTIHRPKEIQIVQHHGIFRRKLSFFEATAFLVSGTIGAGILGIPYAIAQVGVPLGILLIITVGLLMMALLLLLGDVAAATDRDMQMVGFAATYLGKPGKAVMTLITYALLVGVLVVYITGVGETLAALFGGLPFVWSTVFFIIVSLLITGGIRTLKSIELGLCLGVLALVLFLVAVSGAHVASDHFQYATFANSLLPYGVLLFAFHGVSAVPEAHSLLGKNTQDFKRAIVASGTIVTLVYLIFAVVVVGVTGQGTTPIATIGLGQVIGQHVFILGNVFAVLSMGTSSLMHGLALRDSLRWDFKLSARLASIFVAAVPFAIFLLSARSFISLMSIIGGVFVSLQLLMIIFIYWQVRRKHQRNKRHAPLPSIIVPLILFMVFSCGAVYSVTQLMK